MSPARSASVPAPSVMWSCHGWVLHHEALRCATARICSMISRSTGRGRKCRQLWRDSSRRRSVAASRAVTHDEEA